MASPGTARARKNSRLPSPPAIGLSNQSRASRPLGRARLAQALLDARVGRRVADDAALADVGRLQLELRLDEQQRLAGDERRERRQDERERDEREVGDDEVEAGQRQHRRVEPARVHALERTDARVGGDARIELAVADVDADHACRAAPQQHVAEAARALADVEAGRAGDVDRAAVERGLELDAAARDVAQLGVVVERERRRPRAVPRRPCAGTRQPAAARQRTAPRAISRCAAERLGATPRCTSSRSARIDRLDRRLSSGSCRACTGPAWARRCRRPARRSARSASRRPSSGAGAPPSRRGAWAARRPCRPRSSRCA